MNHMQPKTQVRMNAQIPKFKDFGILFPKITMRKTAQKPKLNEFGIPIPNQVQRTSPRLGFPTQKPQPMRTPNAFLSWYDQHVRPHAKSVTTMWQVHTDLREQPTPTRWGGVSLPMITTARPNTIIGRHDTSEASTNRYGRSECVYGRASPTGATKTGSKIPTRNRRSGISHVGAPKDRKKTRPKVPSPSPRKKT